MNKMNLARFMWMQQLQTIYETEIQWPKDELWVFQSLGSTRAVRFCPKTFIFHDIPLFWTLLMPKRLTWSIAEMDSSLHIYKKISNRQMSSNTKTNTLWKKPNIRKIFLNSSIEEIWKRRHYLPVMIHQNSNFAM